MKLGLRCLTKLLSSGTLHLLHVRCIIDPDAPIEVALPALTGVGDGSQVTLTHFGDFARDFAQAEQIFVPAKIVNDVRC
jgi:hypothetical protein